MNNQQPSSNADFGYPFDLRAYVTRGIIWMQRKGCTGNCTKVMNASQIVERLRYWGWRGALEKVGRVRSTSYGEDFRRRWLVDLEKVNAFISSQPICRPGFINRLKLALAYPLYLAEGVLYRIGLR